MFVYYILTRHLSLELDDDSQILTSPFTDYGIVSSFVAILILALSRKKLHLAFLVKKSDIIVINLMIYLKYALKATIEFK